MTNTWKQYEAGKEYKRRIGFYEQGRRNERFYRGDQWYEHHGKDLPKPVFNVVKRVVDYLVCTVASDRFSLTYTDENLPFMRDGVSAEQVRRALSVMSDSAAYRWSKCRMDDVVYQLLLDGAIFGDGVAYCYWDEKTGSGAYRGDVAVQTVDAANLFAADMNNPDIQSQDYVILSGRQRASTLRAEALAAGVSPDVAKKILPDQEREGAGALASTELADEDGKATYLVKFYREDGRVVYEKSTKECLVRRVVTDCRLYPVAHFRWTPVKNAFHGAPPASEMIANQKFINRAYGMVMKHMTDTAFSKVVYDKSRIPEWSNEVGEAIAVVGATNVSDAVSVVDSGRMQGGYLELINSAVASTKELMGATETALGNTVPNNTSAILALREASKISLGQVESALCRCIEDIANVWADMMCAYYSDERLLPLEKNGVPASEAVDLSLLRGCLIRARVDVRETAQYSTSTTTALLDKLLDGGYISVETYLSYLPDGIFPERRAILEAKEALLNGTRDGE